MLCCAGPGCAVLVLPVLGHAVYCVHYMPLMKLFCQLQCQSVSCQRALHDFYQTAGMSLVLLVV